MPKTVTLLISASEPESAAIAAAIERAIQASAAASGSLQYDRLQIKIVDLQALPAAPLLASDILCPLTLAAVSTPNFPQHALYKTCGDIEGLRARVSAQGYATGAGNLWLPIVLTAKGPLYGEAIGQLDSGNFQQPVHLSDAQRQPLYRLGRWLLNDLGVPPAVYLLQMSCHESPKEHGVVFDRLWPFPAAPALASLGRQSPDLFTCHWRCLTHQPIRDLQVRPQGRY
ncbi:MAG: hypothetical protein ACFB5Z_01380 [Elainellaceae cyanobacterium]